MSVNFPTSDNAPEFDEVEKADMWLESLLREYQ